MHLTHIQTNQLINTPHYALCICLESVKGSGILHLHDMHKEKGKLVPVVSANESCA